MLKTTLLVIFVYLFVCFSAAQPEGASPEGFPEGSSPEGSSPEGSSPEGSSPEGSSPEGSSPEGSSPEGSSPDNAFPESSGPEGSTPEGFPAPSGPEGSTPEGFPAPSGPEGSEPELDFPIDDNVTFADGQEFQNANFTDFSTDAWLYALNSARFARGLGELVWDDSLAEAAFCYNETIQTPGRTDSYALPTDTALSVVKVWLAAEPLFNEELAYSCSRVTLIRQCQWYYQLTFAESTSVGCSIDVTEECNHVACFFDPPAHCDDQPNCVYGQL